RVRVEGLGARSLQGDVGFVDLLDRMGATVVRESDATEVIVSEPLHGIDVDMRDISDTVPTMAVVAASASSPSRIRGVGFIREKESDRIGAVVNELRRLGIDAVEEPDGLVVRPGAISPGVVETYDDHRIAMSFALLGLLAPGIVISHPGCVGKTFPGFFSALERIRSNPAMSTPEDDLDDFAGELPVDEPGDMVAAAVIAIDGPAGSGKSTVAREVADRLGLDYLDTGAMYRAVAYSALRHDMDPSDDDAVAELTRRIEIDVTPDRVTVDGADATVEIRGPAVTRAVSTVAANPEVRAELVRRQREWAVDHDGGVIEGRDIGTVVFPNARLKVYLTARSDTRASRRAKEVTDLDYETVAADLARRDALDSSRQHDPLVQAVDAVIIETSELGVDAVVARVLDELDQ
ncbi:MAG: (d)CMP kinase, partial [Acidimicrobiia bacterium]|nr:(d)CMP kinase [Acidimicrobiia bacterium]